MLQALKARMQAMIKTREAEIETKRQAAIDALTQASTQLHMEHDITMAILNAELQMAKASNQKGPNA